ncbi:hypothetical protein Peur_065232 [Populus x canadensis]
MPIPFEAPTFCFLLCLISPQGEYFITTPSLVSNYQSLNLLSLGFRFFSSFLSLPVQIVIKFVSFWHFEWRRADFRWNLASEIIIFVQQLV